MDIDTLVDIDSLETMSYITKGYVDPVKFCEGIIVEFGETVLPENVRHTLARNIPLREETSDCTFSVLTDVAAGRGAYKITIADVRM